MKKLTKFVTGAAAAAALTVTAAAPAEADKPLLEILAGNADQVGEALGELELPQLQRLAELEVAGKGRKGVADAIAAEIAEIEKD